MEYALVPKLWTPKVLFYPNYRPQKELFFQIIEPKMHSFTQIMNPKKRSFTQIMEPKKNLDSRCIRTKNGQELIANMLAQKRGAQKAENWPKTLALSPKYSNLMRKSSNNALSLNLQQKKLCKMWQTQRHIDSSGSI